MEEKEEGKGQVTGGGDFPKSWEAFIISFLISPGIGAHFIPAVPRPSLPALVAPCFVMALIG